MGSNYFLSLAGGAKVIDTISLPLDSLEGLKANRVSSQIVDFKGKKCLEIGWLPSQPDLGDDPPDFAYLPELDLRNGVIEVELAGSVAPGAPAQARGFVGVAFRITPQDMAHEGIYIRPSNGRAEEQIRRNHSCQYYAYPDFPWNRLRSEEPEKYESYVDLEVDAWTKIRVELRDGKARLYVHGNQHPTLVVNDMKADPNRHGPVGLWLGTGSIAHFANLKVTRWE